MEMLRRFKSAADRWSFLIFVATLALVGATIALVYFTMQLVKKTTL